MAIIKKFRIKSFKNINSIIEFNNISLSYGNRLILDNLNFKINGLNMNNYLVLLSLAPDLSLNDIEKLIINRPIDGYKNYNELILLSGINADRINDNLLIYKPDFIQISYTFDLEGKFFHFYSVITLKTRNNNVIRRSTSLWRHLFLKTKT